jgi:UDP-N-acetylmuramoylalanine--D-glutamate ligase
MIPVSEYVDQKVAVFGLGRSGVAAARALIAGGAEVFSWDDSTEGRDNASAEGIPVSDIYALDWRTVAALVLSPGIPLTHPEPHQVVKLADAVNCAVVGDIELFARAKKGLGIENQVVAVTGTNGKSTTTSLIGHLIEASGRQVAVGGNIGTPVLDLDMMGEGGVYVLEISSYQIDLTETFCADVSVLLNITPDHLDRHGSMENYVRIKRRLLERQGPRDSAIVGIDDAESARIFSALEARGVQSVTPFSGECHVSHGTYVEKGNLYDGTGGAHRLITNLSDNPAFMGTHNQQNAAAAIAALSALGIEGDSVAKGLQTFPGLAHRQEQIAIVDGVRFVNDSKATNPVSAARSLSCYGSVYWIAGGRAKEGGFAALEPVLERVEKAYLIGTAQAQLAGFLDGRAAVERSETLAAAIAAAIRDAAHDARDDAVILLSPACASFDQFSDFEARGDAFRDLVAAHAESRRDGATAPGRQVG